MRFHCFFFLNWVMAEPDDSPIEESDYYSLRSSGIEYSYWDEAGESQTDRYNILQLFFSFSSSFLLYLSFSEISYLSDLGSLWPPSSRIPLESHLDSIEKKNGVRTHHIPLAVPSENRREQDGNLEAGDSTPILLHIPWARGPVAGWSKSWCEQGGLQSRRRLSGCCWPIRRLRWTGRISGAALPFMDTLGNWKFWRCCWLMKESMWTWRTIVGTRLLCRCAPRVTWKRWRWCWRTRGFG